MYLLPAVLALWVSAVDQPAAAVVTGATIAVADFTGDDRALGRLITETLLTDLAQSMRLTLLERAELRQAMTEMKLQSSGLTESKSAQQLGRLIGAERLVVGSYHRQSDDITINARVLDVATGRVSAGGAISLSGRSSQATQLTHRLAQALHRRLTGEELQLENMETAPEPAAQAGSAPAAPEVPLLPSGARLNSPITEGEFARIAPRLAARWPSGGGAKITVQRPTATLTRIFVMAVVVKAALQDADFELYRNSGATLPPDRTQIPAWGVGHVSAAVEHGWWPSDRSLSPREPATWAFLKYLLDRIPGGDTSQPLLETSFPPLSGAEITGVIIDARGLGLQRSMSARILDENGRVIYPRPGQRLPDPDRLQDVGLVSYHASPREANRAGSRPMVVPAIAVAGPGQDDVVIPNDMAEQLLSADRRNGFLSAWRVCIVKNTRTPRGN
jgi:TolB-like protein